MNASTASATIDPKEAGHFGKLAADWWDPKGSSAMLHRLNPARLTFIREMIDAHWHGDPKAWHPLEGRKSADIGCGAGLLCEPLARLGATVTGIDAAPENIAAARLHADQQGLAIDYRAGEASQLIGDQFDLVTSMEVIEHVSDVAGFVGTLADLVAPNGLLLLSTPNRTPLSKLMMITLAEGLGQVPKGTHDWSKFLTPDELGELLMAVGLKVVETRGLSYRPDKGFFLSADLSLDYLIAAVPV